MSARCCRKSRGDHHCLTENGLLQIGVLTENRESFLPEPAAVSAIEHSGIDDAGFDSLSLSVLIANGLQLDLVALGVKSQLFQPEQSSHPSRAADTRHAKFLPRKSSAFLTLGRATKS